MDRLIYIRERLLDWITGAADTQVLNSGPSGSAKAKDNHIAAQIKRALDEIKTNAINDKGFNVDYTSLRHSPAYAEYRRMCSPKLRVFDPDTLGSPEEQLAFWVNLYNALVLDAVISFDIQRSVIEGFLGVLAFFRRAAYDVCGLRLSLEDIEHGILRGNRGHPAVPGPQFASDDPRLKWVISPLDVRIHFALNCASRSCPPIQVYSPELINDQLELAARNFINENVNLSTEKDTLRISSIFRWYRRDFGGKERVIEFIQNYLPEDERRQWIAEQGQTIHLRYDPYDWGLNAYLQGNQDNKGTRPEIDP